MELKSSSFYPVFIGAFLPKISINLVQIYVSYVNFGAKRLFKFISKYFFGIVNP